MQRCLVLYMSMVFDVWIQRQLSGKKERETWCLTRQKPEFLAEIDPTGER